MLKNIFSILIVLIAISCKPNENDVDDNLAELGGRTQIVDNQKNLYSDNSGILVHIMENGYYTYTDSVGEWLIEGLNIDSTYSILFSKDSVISRRQYGKRPGIDRHILIWMLETPKYRIDSTSFYYDNSELQYYWRLRDGEIGNIVSYVDTTKNLTFDNNILGLYVRDYWDNSGTIDYPSWYIEEHGIVSGQKIYIISYPVITKYLVPDLWDYDPKEDKYYSTGISLTPSRIDSIVY